MILCNLFEKLSEINNYPYFLNENILYTRNEGFFCSIFMSSNELQKCDSSFLESNRKMSKSTDSNTEQPKKRQRVSMSPCDPTVDGESILDYVIVLDAKSK